MTWLLASLIVAHAANLGCVAHTDPVPTEIAAPVATKVAPGGVRATANGTTIAFCSVNHLPRASWTDAPEATLAGGVQPDAALQPIRAPVTTIGVARIR